MVYELPVVASAISAHKDLVMHEQTGLLFTPEDWDEAADHLIALADNPDKRFSFGFRARRTALSQYDLTRMVAGYDYCYKIAAGRHAALRITA